MATRKSHKIDRIDLKILGALQEQGRMSNLELAAKAGLSASPAHSRHRALERAQRDPLAGCGAQHKTCGQSLRLDDLGHCAAERRLSHAGFTA